MSTRTRLPRLALALCAFALPAHPALAWQVQAPRDSLRLGALHADAARRDPRARQLELLGAQSALRQRDIDVERLPSIGFVGQAQYLSDVPSVPIRLPGAVPPTPPNDQYDAYATARQRLYDPTRGARRDVERARLEESRARVRTSVYATRQAVNDAFFGALLLQAQARDVETGIADLEAQLRVATQRVREGAALPGEAAAIEAELLRRRQSLDAIVAERGATLAVLSDLTGRDIAPGDALAIPDIAAEAARARAGLDALRARPEYEQFASARELVARQREAAAARDLPRVSAFGRAGYGRPGLDPLNTAFDSYWLAGLQVEWAPWTWGATGREREVLAIQQQIVASDEAAFTEGVRRAVTRDLAAMDRLEATLRADDAIIALRERILREARLRFAEGVVTSAEYVDRETDALNARLARSTHLVELAHARARFLTLVGIEVR